MKKHIFLTIILTTLLSPCVTAKSYGRIPLRQYGVRDNLYFQIAAGTEYSFSENTSKANFSDMLGESFTIAFGKNFSPTFGMRLSMSMSRQRGIANQEMRELYPEIGPYKFWNNNVMVDAHLSLINLFAPFRENRAADIALVGGIGMNLSNNFSAAADTWSSVLYPVDTDNHISPQARAGLQVSFKVSEAFDIFAESTIHFTSDKYNGIESEHSINSYLGAHIGLRVHFPDSYDDYRFKYNMRHRSDNGNSLIDDPDREHIFETYFLSLTDRRLPKAAAEPQPLNTVILFYTDRTYVHSRHAEQLHQIARLMNDNPQRTLIIEGYSLAPNQMESETYNLPQLRAESVRDYLVNECSMDAARIIIHAPKDATPPIVGYSEWVPGVMFKVK